MVAPRIAGRPPRPHSGYRGPPLPPARAPQELGGISLEHLATDFTMEELPVSMSFDQSGANQLFDVVRDGGFGYRELLPKPGAGAFLFAGDDLQHLHAPGVREGLGDEVELFIGQLRPLCNRFFHSSIVIELSYDCQARLVTLVTSTWGQSG